MRWYLKYWRQNLRLSFGLWEGHEAVTTLLVIFAVAVLSAISSILGSRVLNVNLNTMISWSLATWFGVLVLVFTPMRMWVTQAKRMRPVLTFIEVRVEAGRLPDERGWGLVIRNIGTEVALGCSARIEALELEEVRPNQTMQWWPINRPLHWAGQETDSYNIPGGQSAHLNVAYCGHIEHQTGQSVTLAYRAEESFRNAHTLPPGVGPILIMISVVSTGQSPQYAVCRLNISLMKNLIASGLARERSEEEPFQLLYFGANRPQIATYQRLQAVSPS